MGLHDKINMAAVPVPEHVAARHRPAVPTLLTTPPTWGLESLASRIDKATKTFGSAYRKDNPSRAHTQRAHDWGFAAGALYKIGHRGAWDSFDYSKHKPMLRGLRSSWGVRDRNSLLATIYWLLTEGHRHEFQRDVSLAVGLDRHDFANLEASLAGRELKWQLRQARANTYGVQGVDFAPWDLIRLIMLSSVGVLAGYLTPDESLDAMALAQSELQPRYQDWQSLGRDFAVGRWFWSGGEDERLVESLASINVLLGDGAAWQIVPYGLTQPRTDGSIVRAVVGSGVVAPLNPAQREQAAGWQLVIDDMIRASGTGGFAPPTLG